MRPESGCYCTVAPMAPIWSMFCMRKATIISYGPSLLPGPPRALKRSQNCNLILTFFVFSYFHFLYFLTFNTVPYRTSPSFVPLHRTVPYHCGPPIRRPSCSARTVDMNEARIRLLVCLAFLIGRVSCAHTFTVTHVSRHLRHE